MDSENSESIKDESVEVHIKSGEEHFKKPIIIRPRLLKKNPEQYSVKSNLCVVSDLSASTDDCMPEKKSNNSGSVIHEEVPTSNIKSTEKASNSNSCKKGLSPEVPYTEPSWKGMPDDTFYLEELKNGVIEREINISERSATVIGRMDTCHICLAHPTISRYHAVLQYRAVSDATNGPGFYLLDLNSTHGTFLNKLRVKPGIHQRIRVGHILKFGGSTRMFILQGPEEDMEEESEFTVTELKEMRKEKLRLKELEEEEKEKKLKEAEELQKQEEEKILERGVDWGMGEDADEETDLSENPYASLTNEECYRNEPRKELTKWMERHGEEVKFDVEQADRGKMVCRVTLPILDEKSQDVVIEASGKSKKEAITACAMEACQHIDRLGLWKQAKQEAHKRTVRNWEENDYYDSDEDSFFDRTGELENKRKKRMKKAGKLLSEVETYDSLIKKHEDLVKELEVNENELARLTLLASKDTSEGNEEDMDELDAFMESLKKERPSKSEIKSCQERIKELRQDENRLIELINVAKPAFIPNLTPAVIRIPKSKKIQKDSKDEDSQVPIDTSSSSKTDAPMEEKLLDIDDKPRVIGPMLPPEIPDMQGSTKASSKKSRSRNKPRKQKLVPIEMKGEDYNNITWIPPEGQTGDGRTSLNDKYGY